MLRMFIGVLSAFALTACVQQTAADLAKSAPPPTPFVYTQASGKTVWDMFPDQGGAGRRYAFAARKYDYPRDGQQSTVAEVYDDLLRDNPKHFGSHIARSQFVRAMSALSPAINSARDVAKILGDDNRHRVVDCPAKIRTLAYNGQGSFHRIERAAKKGEKCVEIKVADRWVQAFSLGCLNPLDASVVRIVADLCPTRWRVPSGSAPANGQDVIVFVPAEAVHCLPPASECDAECVDWMRGYRGTPDDSRIEVALGRMARGGGSAFRLKAGVTEIRLPRSAATTAEYAVWCDRRRHGVQEAHFMEF